MLTLNQLEAPFNASQPHLTNTSAISTNIQQQLIDDSIEDNTREKSGKWTEEEDELLRKYVPLLGEKQWRKISEFIPGRNSIQCLHRWTKILKPGLVKGPWTAEEDQKLIAWVKTEGPNKWAQCATLIEGRSGKQCRERWSNNLDPEVKKGNWSKQEDELIFRLYQVYGSSWSKMAKCIPGRTENAIKNRFYSTLRKLTSDKRKDEFEKHEDLCLGVQGTEGKEILNLGNLGIPSQPQSALYLLLNEKTTPVLLNENIKPENSADSKNLDTTAHLSDKQKQQQSFNIKGEKVMVLRDMKSDDKNLQDPTDKLADEDFQDDDAMEDFLGTLNLGFQKPHDVMDFDALQKNIKNFCQANVSVYSKISKTIEAKTNSEIPENKINNSSAQVQRPAPPMVSTQCTFNTQGPVTPTLPTNFQPNFGTTASPLLNNRTMPSLPMNAALAQNFAQFNSINNAIARQRANLMAKNSIDFRNQAAGVTQVGQFRWNAPFTGGVPQQTFTRNFAGIPQNFPSGGMETDKKVNYLCQHLASLEMLLAKTKQDLACYETYVKQEGNCSGQGNVKFEDAENLRTKQLNGPRPFEFSNSEFDQLLKKMKVE